MPDNVANIIAIISALVAVGSVAVVFWRDRHKPDVDLAEVRKLRADTAGLITKAAGEIVREHRVQIAELRARVLLLEASQKVQTEEIATLRSKVRVLEVENRNLQMENMKLRKGL